MSMGCSPGSLPLLLLSVVLICTPACAPSGYVCQVPNDTDDGWSTASLGEVGMDETRIQALMKGLSGLEDNPLHGIVIVRNGKLVFETYYSGEDLSVEGGLHTVRKEFDRDTVHCLASTSKSVTSILMGIAIDLGIVGSVDEKLFSFFPEYAHLSDAVKDDITLRHALTMSSGIPWDESHSYTDPRNDVAQMYFLCEDPVEYVLGKDLVATPGDVFIYNTGTTNLLGEVVKRSSGESLMEFADRYLFAPLGIVDCELTDIPAGSDIAAAASLLYLRPRDMAKLGQLYLEGGTWDGRRVVPEAWVAESTAQEMAVAEDAAPIQGFNTTYGYQWWRGTFETGTTDTYYAAGWGGQFIFVLPDVDMVIVFTAGHYKGDYGGFYQIVNDHILPAAGVS